MTTFKRDKHHDMRVLILRHRVNELAYKEGRITPAEFVATREKIRDRMEVVRARVD